MIISEHSWAEATKTWKTQQPEAANESLKGQAVFQPCHSLPLGM